MLFTYAVLVVKVGGAVFKSYIIPILPIVDNKYVLLG
jgi:hypothetical protein